jgi:RimJ/RimL family protein N-acetyltransferase
MEFYLREITREDIPLINKWHNDKELIDNLSSVFRYVNIETDEEWFDNYQKKRNFENRLAICMKEKNKLVGVVYIKEIDWINRNALYGGIILGDKGYHFKGIGTEVTREIIKHVFENLNLSRFYGYWLEYNKESLAMGKKCGFIEEGNLRNAIYKNGKYHNLIIMSILREEYDKININK